MTDGQDNNPPAVIAAAKKLQAKDASIFVIGVGNPADMNTEMMNQVATEPVLQHIKHARTVEGINQVSHFICKNFNFYQELNWKKKFPAKWFPKVLTKYYFSEYLEVKFQLHSITYTV